MWRISWTDRIRNEEVLRRLGKERELIKTIKKRKLEYLGHIMRGEKYRLLRLILEGKVKGKRSVGRRRVSWLHNLREWYGCGSADLFRAAADRNVIADMVSDLR